MNPGADILRKETGNRPAAIRERAVNGSAVNANLIEGPGVEYGGFNDISFADIESSVNINRQRKESWLSMQQNKDTPEISRDKDPGETLQRRIMVSGPVTWYGTRLGSGWNTLNASSRRAFLRANRSNFAVGGRSHAALAGRIVGDMAAASDPLRFSNNAELLSEVRKRLVTARTMRTSQGVRRGGRWMRAFGYPNRGAALTCGPRVNYAARAMWDGPYNDPNGNYYFRLSSAGRVNPYQALQNLFVNQARACRRTLIHCDYLVSTIHFKAFAESIGATEFNRRVGAGTIPLVLRWDGFRSLQRRTGRSAQTTSLRLVRPASKRDLIIGDHVYFHNHPMYAALIAGVGGVWRLENAILVDRIGGVDKFQGHGYTTPVSEIHMKRSMMRHLTRHVNRVRGYIRQYNHSNRAVRARARRGLARYRNVYRRGTQWRVIGRSFYGIVVNEPVHLPPMTDLPGLQDPRNTSVLFPVRRPVESI